MKHTPPPRDSWQDALDQAREWENATPMDHYRGLEAALKLAAVIIASRPREEGWDAQEPIPEASRRHLVMLHKQSRWRA